jgi:hypothetical protein
MRFRDGLVPDKRILLRPRHPSAAESALADVPDPQNLIVTLGEGPLKLLDGGEVKSQDMSRSRIKHHLPHKGAVWLY